ncbi:uncharacterized protein LOC127728239 isoform X1 [Mytilus californianus]|uniref:uncharacterized protein LOC127728239 isoform X1 n=1 Tax=Mytilus californianus TaxID=6549 RepID=UPI002247DA04|nr:uncharacterized protein LOC127728239 isoform X1 [Mytilus californianus]XP_052091465.1 uncharacterized protein LOC127728239 isoform X1 [Mytilus californianus]XP_052091466.1 uncharacterized protein LOC127728239 isoform X1 [Mytilus californianus]XP_052091467.1 uncharacterized protein LOC127728239 isoform X1 [Mytilus californianus]
MKKERKRKVQTKTIKDTDKTKLDKTKLDKEENNSSVSSSQLPNDENKKIVPAFGKKQKLSSTVGREQNSQVETIQSQHFESASPICSVTDTDQQLQEDENENVLFEDKIPVGTSNKITVNLDQKPEMNSKNCKHLLSSDCADQLVLPVPSNSSDAMIETDIEISYAPNIDSSPVSDTPVGHPDELSLNPNKITDDFDDRPFLKSRSPLERSTYTNKLIVYPSEIVSTDHANILSKDECCKMVPTEVENKPEYSGNIVLSEAKDEIGYLSTISMKEISREEKDNWSECVVSQNKSCSQVSENEVGHFEETQVLIPEETIEDELTQVFAQLEDEHKGNSVSMTEAKKQEAQQTSKNIQSMLEVQHNSSVEDRKSSNDEKLSENCCSEKPMENYAITDDTEITVSDKEVVLQISNCDLHKVSITSKILDKSRESEEITDSQLCTIDWVEEFTLPEKIERKPFLHDGITVVQGLIRELSQLNTMILRTKRELETTRRQLLQGQATTRIGQVQHQGQTSEHTTIRNRNQPLRTFNRH